MNTAHRTARLCPAEEGGASCVVAPIFSVIVFAADTLAVLCFFERQKKNKQLHPQHEAKNNAIKKWGELLKHKVAL